MAHSQIQADLPDRAAIIAACAGMESAVLDGAVLCRALKAQIEAVNVGGTEAAIDATSVAGLVDISSPAIFTGADQVEADERWPIRRLHDAATEQAGRGPRQ